ncbi:sigma-70 family RNA polymerase sigma factor [Akkermansiaceae bacterium]|nr:sigma-70 family RNA polymerase sigma factor [Akkermansiaceae bacterium]
MSEPAPSQNTVDNAGDGLQLQEFVSQLTASQGRIRAFVVTLMPGSPDVTDVVQETNLVLWKSRARYRTGSNFLAWAFTIARLEVLHQRSRTKRYGRILISEELLDMLAAEVPDEGSHDEYLDALDKCKSKLTETQRELIEYRYQRGRSIEDYAEQTGRKASALRVALMRTRIALRECIEKTMGGHPA